MPSKKLYPHQQKVVDKAIEILKNDNKNITIQAPVGSGKSFISYYIAKEFKNSDPVRSLIVCPTNDLLIQYLNETSFYLSPLFSNQVIKDCLRNNICNIYIKNVIANNPVSKKLVGKRSQISEISRKNYTNIINGDRNLISTISKAFYLARNKKFIETNIDLLIVDEAHLLFDYIQLALSGKFYLIERPTNRFEHMFNECVQSIIQESSVLPLQDYDFDKICKDIEYELKTTNQDHTSNSLNTLADLKIKYLWLLDEFEKLSIASEYTQNYETRSYNNGVEIALVNPMPLIIYFLNQFKKVVLMSGTIKTSHIPKEFIDSAQNITIDSLFPNSKVVVYKPQSTTIKSLENRSSFDTLVDKILEICNNYPNQRGIIHTTSYVFSQKLVESVFLLNPRFVLHHPKKLKDFNYDQVSDLLKTNKDTIVVSVNSSVGVDLKDDLCRFQIIPKIDRPLFDLTSKISKNYYLNPDKSLLTNYMITFLEQVRGRGIRNKDDYSTLYILDNSIYFYIKQWQKHYPYFYYNIVKE